MAASLLSSAAAAQPAATPEPGESYWGALPAMSDTVAVPLADRPKAVWERALLAPYRAVTFPIALASRGIGSGIEYLDDHSVLDRVARLLGPRRGPFGLLVDFRFGGLSGLGGGLTAEHGEFFGKGNTLRIRAATSTKHDHRLGVAARFRRPRGAYWEAGAGYRQRPNVRYFGVGPDTREEDESFLHQETFWTGATIRRPLGGESHIDLDLQYTNVATGAPGPSHDPPTGEAFASALPAGYGRHSYGVSAGAQWMHESTGLANRPGHGGIERLRTVYFEGTGRDQVRYWTFRGEMQRFVTLWRPQRVLALRGVASWIEDVGDDPVPAARLNTNDDPDLLRGYDDFRFRDRGLAILTAEYRWPVWALERGTGAGVDAYLLSDAGQVFGDADQLGLRHLTLSYGGGLRVESGHGFVLRIEYARSDEASVVRFRADQVFQFVKHGFLYGREPIPAR